MYAAVTAIRRGATHEGAAVEANVTRRTLSNWLRRGEIETCEPYVTFSRSFRAAQAEYRREHADTIAKALRRVYEDVNTP